jgi:thioredoxin-related protein
MKIILFTRVNGEVPRLPNRPGLEFKHIHFESSNLDDLMLIAQHRVIDYPTSIIVDNNGRTILRLKGSIPSDYVDTILESEQKNG